MEITQAQARDLQEA